MNFIRVKCYKVSQLNICEFTELKYMWETYLHQDLLDLLHWHNLHEY